MGDAPSARRAEARVPRRDDRIARRRLLKGIGALRFGTGRECTLLSSMAVATGSAYDWLMGCSGAAFSAAIDEQGWDPLAAAPLDEATCALAARAAGVRADRVAPPYDDDMRALVIERIAEALDAKLPPLVQGLVGPAEYGLLIGLDDEGPTFFARTYFDHGDEPTRVGWEAFRDDRAGTPVFLDRAAEPERAALARESVTRAATLADAAHATLATWTAALRDDTRWTDAKHTGTAAFADHAMRAIYVDKRRAAARFLREVRGLFPNAPGADLLRAAESYGYAADAGEKGGTGEFGASVAMRFLDGGHRRAWANLLEGASRHEREARDALASAASAIR